MYLEAVGCSEIFITYSTGEKKQTDKRPMPSTPTFGFAPSWLELYTKTVELYFSVNCC